MSDDARMAQLARALAEALCEYARDRRADHKIRISELHTELCKTWRAEQAAAFENAYAEEDE